MFKNVIRSTLFLTLVALFPATATADAKEDILLMGLYRGFDEAAFCSMAIVGDRPVRCSIFGRSSWPRNCRA